MLIANDNLNFRFATEEYTNDPEMISNNFIHLTNFSINKESDNFVNNSNPDEPEVRTVFIIIYHTKYLFYLNFYEKLISKLF